MTMLFSAGNFPFTVAVVLMLCIGGLELIAMLIGGSMFETCDDFVAAHIDVDASEGALSNVLSWLHIGKVPLLVLLVLSLMGFAVAGFGIQAIALFITGHAFPASVASVIAIFPAASIVRTFGGVIGKYVPKIETTAVSSGSFVGKTATVIGAEASFGNAAEAKLADEHGQTHYFRVEPDEGAPNLKKGDRALLVGQISSTCFRVIHYVDPDELS